MTNEPYYSPPSSSPREKNIFTPTSLKTLFFTVQIQEKRGKINVTSTTYARKEIPMKLLKGYSYYKILARDQLYDYTNAVQDNKGNP